MIMNDWRSPLLIPALFNSPFFLRASFWRAFEYKMRIFLPVYPPQDENTGQKTRSLMSLPHRQSNFCSQDFLNEPQGFCNELIPIFSPTESFSTSSSKAHRKQWKFFISSVGFWMRPQAAMKLKKLYKMKHKYTQKSSLNSSKFHGE